MHIDHVGENSGYIVISAAHGPAHTPYVHGHAHQAFLEAERLARVHGGKFYVLEVKGFAERTDVRTVRYKSEDADIPF